MKSLVGVASLLVLGGACTSSIGHAPSDQGGPGDVDLAGFVHTGEPVDLAGFDFPPQLGIIYAHTATTLYTVDPMTYALHTIGDFGGTDAMTDLAVTPDGNVYTISKTALYKVNATTGAATQLFAGIATSNVALTFLNNGTLLAADQAGGVRVIDPVTGDVQELGTYGAGYDTAGDLVAIADGTMFGVSTKAPGIATTKKNVLIKVNVTATTAPATTVGGIGYDGVFGVAYAGGRVLAFTSGGLIISIDPSTGKGTQVADHSAQNIKFYGAGTSPLVPVL
jgi:hypothetical protein